MDIINVTIWDYTTRLLSSVNSITIEVPMSHIILFSLFLLVFFLLGSQRGVTVTSFIFAINLGVVNNSGLLLRGLENNPVLWVPYMIVGTLFFVILILGLMYSH